MPVQPGEWEYLYQTTPSSQVPWELGGPDTCLTQLVEAKKFPAGGRILDLGCGLGSAAVYLAALGFAVTGVDLSSTAVTKARQKAVQVGVQVEFLTGDALTLPLAGRSFDVVYDRGCFQHINRERWPVYKKQVLRILKPRGQLALEVSQDQVSVDDLKQLFGKTLLVKTTTSVTHVERHTGIPRYHTFALLARR